MLMWIVPISVFLLIAAIVLGGGPVTIEGHSVSRQLLGLFATHYSIRDDVRPRVILKVLLRERVLYI